ncbi:MAG TPA: hypothetical protein VNR39_05680 [Pseudolabrys sp.]|nr:hypothetical protein [Pseudolabrys sp.]
MLDRQPHEGRREKHGQERDDGQGDENAGELFAQPAPPRTAEECPEIE